jgi:hypothetical protein
VVRHRRRHPGPSEPFVCDCESGTDPSEHVETDLFTRFFRQSSDIEGREHGPEFLDQASRLVDDQLLRDCDDAERRPVRIPGSLGYGLEPTGTATDCSEG